MSYDFNKEDKEIKEFADRIPFGVHQVQLVGAEAGETDVGTNFIEMSIVSANGIEDKARLWFTGGASNISFNTIRQILVHNGKTEEQKAQVRDKVDAAKNTDELAEILTAFSGAQLWLTKYYDPTRTYTNQAGETKRSINTNVYGYEPKLKPELMPQKSTVDQVLDSVQRAMPGAELEVPFGSKGDAPGSSAASTIPADKDWSK